MNTKKTICYNSCLHINQIIAEEFGKDVIWNGNFERRLLMKVHNLISKLNLTDDVFTGKAFQANSDSVSVDSNKFGLYSKNSSVDLSGFFRILSQNI